MPRSHEQAVQRNRSILSRESPERTLRRLTKVAKARAAAAGPIRDYIGAVLFSAQPGIFQNLAAEAILFDYSAGTGPFAGLQTPAITGLAVQVATHAFNRLVDFQRHQPMVERGDAKELLMQLRDCAAVLGAFPPDDDDEAALLYALASAQFDVVEDVLEQDGGTLTLQLPEQKRRITAAEIRSSIQSVRQRAVFDELRSPHQSSSPGVLDAMKVLQLEGVLGNPSDLQLQNAGPPWTPELVESFKQCAVSELRETVERLPVHTGKDARELREAMNLCRAAKKAIAGENTPTSMAVLQEAGFSQQFALTLIENVKLANHYARLQEAIVIGLPRYAAPSELIDKLWEDAGLGEVPAELRSIDELVTALEQHGFANARRDLHEYPEMVRNGEKTTMRCLALRVLRAEEPEKQFPEFIEAVQKIVLNRVSLDCLYDAGPERTSRVRNHLLLKSLQLAVKEVREALSPSERDVLAMYAATALATKVTSETPYPRIHLLGLLAGRSPHSTLRFIRLLATRSPLHAPYNVYAAARRFFQPMRRIFPASLTADMIRFGTWRQPPEAPSTNPFLAELALESGMNALSRLRDLAHGTAQVDLATAKALLGDLMDAAVFLEAFDSEMDDARRGLLRAVASTGYGSTRRLADLDHFAFPDGSTVTGHELQTCSTMVRWAAFCEDARKIGALRASLEFERSGLFGEHPFDCGFDADGRPTMRPQDAATLCDRGLHELHDVIDRLNRDGTLDALVGADECLRACRMLFRIVHGRPFSEVALLHDAGYTAEQSGDLFRKIRSSTSYLHMLRSGLNLPNYRNAWDIVQDLGLIAFTDDSERSDASVDTLCDTLQTLGYAQIRDELTKFAQAVFTGEQTTILYLTWEASRQNTENAGMRNVDMLVDAIGKISVNRAYRRAFFEGRATLGAARRYGTEPAHEPEIEAQVEGAFRPVLGMMTEPARLWIASHARALMILQGQERDPVRRRILQRLAGPQRRVERNLQLTL